MKNKAYRRAAVKAIEGAAAIGAMLLVILLAGNAAHLLQVMLGVV